MKALIALLCILGSLNLINRKLLSQKFLVFTYVILYSL